VATLNPGIRVRWPDERIARAKEILAEHTSMSVALAAMSREFDFEVTFASVDSVLRKGGSKASAFLAKKPAGPLPPPPVAAPPPSAPRMPPVEIVDDRADARHPADEDGDTLEQPAPQVDATVADITNHRLRSQVADLSSANKRLVRELADREEQLAILREVRAGARPLPPIVEAPKVGGTQRQGVPVLVCSDWHIEEPVDPKTVNGLNEYSLDIADACISRLVEAFEWLMRDSRYDCRTAIIALLGDLLSGYIHDELQERNFLSPTQAILWLAERIEKMLRRIAVLCPSLERIIVACCDGNHGRTTHKIRVSTRTANSYEWMLYHFLASKMADDPRFEFRIADGEWLFVDVFDAQIAFTHGDSFQYGGGVGGISIPIRRGVARQFQGRRIAKFCMGHFHQQQDLGDILINGSLIGYSPYAMRVHAPFEPRKQSWFMWDSRRGQAMSAPVWL
jgi:hypothetical protein